MSPPAQSVLHAPVEAAAEHFVLVVGTPRPVAPALRTVLHHGVADTALTESAEPLAVTPETEVTLRDALRRPQGRIVAVVDAPEAVLARALADGTADNPGAVLTQWSAGARVLLRQVQTWPSRFVLIDSDEAAAAPQALAALVRGWSPVLATAEFPVAAAPVDDDALARLVARALVAAEGQAAQQLYEDLLASCVPLSDAPATKRQCVARAALTQRKALHVELDGLNTQLAAAQQLVREVAEKAQQAAATARADAEQCYTELQQSRQEADSADLQRQASLAESARLLAELQQARQEAERTYLLHQTSLTESARLLAELQQARQAAQDADQQRQTCQAESDLLLKQVQQVQQELTKQCLLDTALYGTAPLRVGGLRVAHVRDTAPHREVHLVLSNVSRGSQQWPTVEVRLVEHGGRPGVVIFATGADREPIAAWKPDGDEKGRGFMLFVPQDAAARKRLLRLGTSDWAMVQSLARVLHNELASLVGAKVPSHWQAIAARLVRQLAELPPRLRYDQLDTAAGPDREVEVTLERAMYGAQPLGSVRLRWEPAARTVRWLAAAKGGSAPLGAWPTEQTGQLQPEFVLPVGATGGLAALELAARDLVVALLDSLAVAAKRAPAEVGLSTAALRARARALRRGARLALLRAQAAGLLGRALRRLGRRRTV